MLDLINQAQREKDGIIALYNPKRAIYGTDGIIFATGTNGQVYRAIDTKANIGIGSVLTDTTKWLKVDLINGQNAYNKDLGAVKTGLEIVRGDDLKHKQYITSYTIARSLSYGMNITFAKMGYIYGGTLINNTNICGSLESMNIWYKHL